MKVYKDIDAYIKDYPKEVQKRLRELRVTIQKAAPKATETISYGIPTFKLNGSLVHFGAFKKHISFFPGSAGISMFKTELSRFPGGKGTVRFPVDAPLPLPLITRIVNYRVKQQEDKVSKQKTCTRGHVFEKTKAHSVCPKCWPGQDKKSK